MPSAQLFEAFLELALATDVANPAPFSCTEFKETFANVVPPWSTSATPENTGMTAKELDPIKAFASKYYALRDAASRQAYSRLRGQNNNTAGRESMKTYLSNQWQKWKLNEVLDEHLSAVGVNLYTVTMPDMSNMVTMKHSGAAAAYKSIGARLFGQDAWMSSTIPHPYVSQFVATLVATTWARWRAHLKREAKRFREGKDKLKAQAAKFTATVEGGGTSTGASSTKLGTAYVRAIKALLNRLNKWKATHDFARDMAEALQETLRGMEETLRKEPAEAARKLPVDLRRAIETMASKEDCLQVLGDVVDLINATEGDEDAAIPTLMSTLSDWKEGVEEYAKLSIDDLVRRLGLRDRHIPFFNVALDTHGTADPWSVEGQAAMSASTAEPLAPRWHQYVGIAKIFDNHWKGLNVLLMDDVGVGKTLQIVATISIYHFYVLWSDRDAPAYKRYCARLGIKAKAPSQQMHVIVIPPALFDQWLREIHRYLRKGSFNVLPYTGKCTADNRAPFWRTVDDSIIPVIIIAKANAIRSDMQTYYHLGAGDDPPRVKRDCPPALRELTVFSANRRYGVFALDEAHVARKFTPLRAGCLELRRLSEITVAASATPMVTSPSDLVSLGKVLGADNLDADLMEEFRKEVTNARRRRSKGAVDEGELQLARQAAVGTTSDEALQDELSQALDAWVKALREGFAEVTIRRTVNSVDNEGRPISNLPPYYDVVIVVKLSDQEMSVQIRIADDLVGEGAHLDNEAVKSFYLTLRQALLHLCFGRQGIYRFSEEDRSRPYSELKKSTKIDTLNELLVHHYMVRCPPPMVNATDRDGQPIPGTLVVGEPIAWSTPLDDLPRDKIIIYLAFPKNNWIVINSLKELGISYIEANGLLTAPQRTKAIATFCHSEVDVLLLSGVGLCGLNLACANVVIMIDNVWSAQEEQQLIGRVNRYPQKKPVYIYRIIAAGTCDVLMQNIAYEKGRIHDAFIGMHPHLVPAFRPVDTQFVDEFEMSEDDDDSDRPKRNTKNSASSNKQRRPSLRFNQEPSRTVSAPPPLAKAPEKSDKEATRSAPQARRSIDGSHPPPQARTQPSSSPTHRARSVSHSRPLPASDASPAAASSSRHGQTVVGAMRARPRSSAGPIGLRAQKTSNTRTPIDNTVAPRKEITTAPPASTIHIPDDALSAQRRRKSISTSSPQPTVMPLPTSPTTAPPHLQRSTPAPSDPGNINEFGDELSAPTESEGSLLSHAGLDLTPSPSFVDASHFSDDDRSADPPFRPTECMQPIPPIPNVVSHKGGSVAHQAGTLKPMFGVVYASDFARQQPCPQDSLIGQGAARVPSSPASSDALQLIAEPPSRRSADLGPQARTSSPERSVYLSKGPAMRSPSPHFDYKARQHGDDSSRARSPISSEVEGAVSGFAKLPSPSRATSDVEEGPSSRPSTRNDGKPPAITGPSDKSLGKRPATDNFAHLLQQSKLRQSADTTPTQHAPIASKSKQGSLMATRYVPPVDNVAKLRMGARRWPGVDGMDMPDSAGSSGSRAEAARKKRRML